MTTHMTTRMVAPRGVFVCVEGPSGVGKSTLIAALTRNLNDSGHSTDAVKEPSASPIGRLIRAHVDTTTPHALACLVAADRYEHLTTEIEPALDAGRNVLTDRYLPSSLVLQCADGVDTDWVLDVNRHIPSPDLYLFLAGAPASNRDRSSRRTDRDRFHRTLDPAEEAQRFTMVAATLSERGERVVTIDVDHKNADEVSEEAMALLAPLLT